MTTEALSCSTQQCETKPGDVPAWNDPSKGHRLQSGSAEICYCNELNLLKVADARREGCYMDFQYQPNSLNLGAKILSL